MMLLDTKEKLYGITIRLDKEAEGDLGFLSERTGRTKTDCIRAMIKKASKQLREIENVQNTVA